MGTIPRTRLNYICKLCAKHKKISEIFSEIKKNNRLCDIFLNRKWTEICSIVHFCLSYRQKCTVYNSCFWNFWSLFSTNLGRRDALLPDSIVNWSERRPVVPRSTFYRFRLTVDSLIPSLSAACLTLPCVCASVS